MAAKDDTDASLAWCDACKREGPQCRVGDSRRLLRCPHCGFVGVINVYHWHDEDAYRAFITRNWHVLGPDDLDRLDALGVGARDLLSGGGG